MESYKVVWEIDILADTPRDAAVGALAVMRDRKSSALNFGVACHGMDWNVNLFEDPPARYGLSFNGETWFYVLEDVDARVMNENPQAGLDEVCPALYEKIEGYATLLGEPVAVLDKEGNEFHTVHPKPEN